MYSIDEVFLRLVSTTKDYDTNILADMVGEIVGAMPTHTDMPIHWANSVLQTRRGVVLERNARELNGEPCLTLKMEPTAKKGIVCSRSFGRKFTDSLQLQEGVGN